MMEAQVSASPVDCDDDCYNTGSSRGEGKEERMPPTVFLTGTTIYKPDKCWNGYTMLSDDHRNRRRSHRY